MCASITKKPSSTENPLARRKLIKLRGVGVKLAEKLAKLHLTSVEDLLFHLPARYQDRTRLSRIGSLYPSAEAVIAGEVVTSTILFGKRRSLVCKIQDGSGTLGLRFFHFSASQKEKLDQDRHVLCYGEVRLGANGLEMVHPEYKTYKEIMPPLDDTLTPFYPTTEGVTQHRLRDLTDQALAQLIKEKVLAEYLPQSIREQFKLSDLADAIQFIHRPPPNIRQEDIQSGSHPSLQRLAFEELLTHHLSLLRLRYQIRQQGAPALKSQPHRLNQFIANLSFTLTDAQQRVMTEIKNDMAEEAPMLRLVQGDVGSGKTIIAAIATLIAVDSDKQAAIMAPTEILAEQHYENFKSWFEPLGIKVAWLSGKLKGKKRQEQLDLIASGDAKAIVGTHALFQKDVIFHDLAMVTIDEQHRFGVHQRLALKDKARLTGYTPHQLIMTATPIPRTLAMSAYADLDTSVIDELPPGRSPVNTVVIENTRRQQVIERVRNACQEKKQCYWVCTLIDESEALQCQAAEDTATQLSAALPEFRIALVHGRLKSAEKAAVMARFKKGDVDLLVATTVIEVGVDVPNASVMVIENPERLGLAQLHQLRGRVGRGEIQSYCVLLYQSPLSPHGKSRLNIMRESSDGFVIAEKDLELRGPGEVLGTRQTGELQFRIADLIRDEALLEKTKLAAQDIIQNYPDAIEPLVGRWLGHKEQYGQV
ncbi:MAG: ATP-dependent DNA helicase RecG [Pseudomonadales bacterium]|nr:ATP-dependent DNA helicase RecG [Pseudomonadales bacterium]